MTARRWMGALALVASALLAGSVLLGRWAGTPQPSGPTSSTPSTEAASPSPTPTPSPSASPPVADASPAHSFMFKVGHGIGQVEPGMYEVDALSPYAWCSWSVYDGHGEMFGGVIPTTGGVVVPSDAEILLLQGCGDLREPAGMVEPASPGKRSEEVV